MKTSKFKFSIWLAGSALVVFGAISSCSKSNNSGGTTPPTSADSASGIEPAALVAYWPFNTDLTETKQGLTATNSGLTFGSGVKGGAVQGSSSAYAAYASAGSSLPALASFTISFWIKSNAVDTAFKTNTPGHGAQAIFFLADTANQFGNLGIDLEPYKGSAPGANPDTLNVKLSLHSWGAGVVWAGWGPNLILPAAVGQWVQVVFTYNGGSGTLVGYENGIQGGTGSLGGPYGPFNGSETIYANDPGSSTNTKGAPIMGNFVFKNMTGMSLGTWPWDTSPQIYTHSPVRGNNWEDNYAGLLDEMRIYNIALSPVEVDSLYSKEKRGL
jgi:Concanavalin A-like lectin/glucanases superfamily